MWWLIGIVVVLLLLVFAARRVRRGPSYDDQTQGRIDDHQVQNMGENMRDRFGGGTI